MKMSGSNQEIKREVYRTFKEAYAHHLEIEDVVKGEPSIKRKLNAVVTCRYCGQQFWGSHTSEYCADCKEQAIKKWHHDWHQKHKKYSEARTSDKKHSQFNWDQMPETELAKKIIEESDAVRERKETIAEWNAAHCCPFFEGYGHGSQKCFWCMRGVNYAGAKTVSNRRCPNNPIATDGSRYIQRTAYRKDANGNKLPNAGKRYDVADNMPQHLKVELVQRMQKLGREYYLWSDGHVDITPDPNSNN